MSRSLKQIKAEFDATTDDFVREQLITEVQVAADEVQQKIKRALIPVAIIWLVVAVGMALNFVFPVNTETYFLISLMGTAGVLGFVLALMWTLRNFQRERYAAVQNTFQAQLAQA